MTEKTENSKDVRTFDNERVEVLCRKSAPISHPDMPLAPTCNKGEHIIHTGGAYDSHLLVPMNDRGSGKP